MFLMCFGMETISAQEVIPQLIKPFIISTKTLFAAYFLMHYRIFLLQKQTLHYEPYCNCLHPSGCLTSAVLRTSS